MATYDGHDASWLEKSVQILQELEREQRDGLCTARKDIMDDVVKLPVDRRTHKPVSITDRVLDDGSVVLRKLKVLGRKLVNRRVNLDHRGINPMRNQRARRSPNTKSPATVSFYPPYHNRNTYTTNAFASLSTIFFGIFTNLTASSIANTPYTGSAT